MSNPTLSNGLDVQHQASGQLDQLLSASAHEVLDPDDFCLWPACLNNPLRTEDLWVVLGSLADAAHPDRQVLQQWFALADPVSGWQAIHENSTQANTKLLGAASLPQLRQVLSQLGSIAPKTATSHGLSAVWQGVLAPNTYVAWTDDGQDTQPAPWIVSAQTTAAAIATACEISGGHMVTTIGELRDLELLVASMEHMVMTQDFSQVLCDHRDSATRLGFRELGILKSTADRQMTAQHFHEYVAKYGIDDFSGPGPLNS
jgi:hypothetical protein